MTDNAKPASAGTSETARSAHLTIRAALAVVKDEHASEAEWRHALSVVLMAICLNLNVDPDRIL
jgi:hypothetical protein